MFDGDTADALAARVVEFWEQRESIRESVRESLAGVRQASQHQFDWLAGFLRPDLSVEVEGPDE